MPIMAVRDEFSRPIRRSFWRRQRSSTGLILICLGWLALEIFVLPLRVVPPPWVQTFDDFLQWQPDARDLMIIRYGETPLLAATGKSAAFLLASGPSMYVFDQSGRMFAWTRDCGDDHRFGHAGIIERIAVSQARSRLRRGTFTQTAPAP